MMLLLLPLLNRIPVRMRMITGLLLIAAGAALVLLSAAAAYDVTVHGLISMFVGVVFIGSALRARAQR